MNTNALIKQVKRRVKMLSLTTKIRKEEWILHKKYEVMENKSIVATLYIDWVDQFVNIFIACFYSGQMEDSVLEESIPFW